MPEQRFYTGYSGQMAVVAELVFRRCNAAVPALDEGTDVFAFKEDRPEVARLQVKTAQGQPYANGGCSGLFKIPLKVLEAVDDPPLFYALAVRLEGKWVDFIVVGRTRLQDYRMPNPNFGTLDKANQNLFLRIQFRPAGVTCSNVDLTPHRNAWNDLPPLQLPVAIAPPPPHAGAAAPAVPPAPIN